MTRFVLVLLRDGDVQNDLELTRRNGLLRGCFELVKRIDCLWSEILHQNVHYEFICRESNNTMVFFFCR